ncbi:nitroreductase family protein [Polycladidibacter stylochi]|uniref:nitroreductase family protein n=1 Tax=Polycladidibacter stylochi TaxID=1807766 RepID=UPI000832A909|nr:nitroreductase [Pseudovibrio stylochi]
MNKLEFSLAALLEGRNSASLKKMQGPAPTSVQLQNMIEAAGTAPDHGKLRPFRFMEVSDKGREKLAQLFAKCHRELEPNADEAAIERARSKAFKGPMLLMMIVTLDESKECAIPTQEQWVSAGAGLQNLLLMAEAQGLASRVTSGRSVQLKSFHDGLGLQENEQFLCFISLGTVEEPRLTTGRPLMSDLHSIWGES